MKKGVFFLLSLFTLALHNKSIGQDKYHLDNDIFRHSSEQKLDKKPKFIPKRMTYEESSRLKNYINNNLAYAKNTNNETLKNKYEQLAALIEKLISGQLAIGSLKAEKIYSEYFNLIIDELKALGGDPQLILEAPDLRYKLLTGQLEDEPWFVREIAAMKWFFEQDDQNKALLKDKNKINPSLNRPLRTVQLQWPTPKDKALYIIGLIEQIERNYQRVENKEDLAAIIGICEYHLTLQLPEIPGILKRIAQEALNKLTKIRNIRGISSLKE